MRFFVLIALLATWSVTAEAERFGNLNFSDIFNVRVQINDQADGACWTNLKEAREYAEEKFRINGVNLSKGDPSWLDRSYDFRITVNAARVYQDGGGPCFGYTDIRLVTFAKVNEHYHLASGYEEFAALLQNDNFNKFIIERIGKFFAEMK